MSSVKGNKVGIKRTARLKNAKGQMQQFAHERDNQGFAAHPARLKAFSKGRQNWIVLFSHDSGQVQSGAQGRLAALGNMGGFMNGRAGRMMTRIQARKGNQLTSITEVGDAAKLRV